MWYALFSTMLIGCWLVLATRCCDHHPSHHHNPRHPAIPVTLLCLPGAGWCLLKKINNNDPSFRSTRLKTSACRPQISARCGNFDIILDHLSRICLHAPYRPMHAWYSPCMLGTPSCAPCDVSCSASILIGCWLMIDACNVMGESCMDGRVM